MLMQNKQKTKRLKEFRIHNFIGHFSSDMAEKGFVHILSVYTQINIIFYLDSFSMPHMNQEVTMKRQFSF